MPLSQFDGIVYINLDRCPERERAFYIELGFLDVDATKVYRITAVDDPFNGVRGCLLSHIKALDFIEENGWKRGLILEDDAIFIGDSKRIKEEVTHFFNTFKEEWDVFLLEGSYFEALYTPQEKIYQITNSDRSHAYSVHPNYLSTLRNCFQDSVDSIRSHLFFQQSAGYAVDAVWTELQKKDRWVCTKRVPM